jgi:hypothetical protein
LSLSVEMKGYPMHARLVFWIRVHYQTAGFGWQASGQAISRKYSYELFPHLWIAYDGSVYVLLMHV